MGRRIAVGLVAVLGFSGLPAFSSVCTEDASACADTSAAASCRSFGVVSTRDGQRRGASEASIGTASPSSDSEAVKDQGVRYGTFLGLIDIGAMSSSCIAEAPGPLGGGRRACGRAQAGDVMIDLTSVAGVAITARTLVTENCSTVGGGGSTSSESRIEQLVLHVNGGTGPVNIMTQENTRVGLPFDLYLIVNERIPGARPCAGTSGAALRIQAPDGSVAIGWVSTRACT